MNRKLASFISYLFHPLLLPILGVGLLLLFHQDYALYKSSPRWLILGLVSVNTLLAPLLSISLLKFRGEISSYHMPLRSERIKPLLYTALFYLVSFYLLVQSGLQGPIVFFMLGCGIAAVGSLVITWYWFKISLHSTAVSGLIALMLCALPGMHIQAFYLLPVALLLAGLVGSARLAMDAHDPKQVYWGYLLGLAAVFIAFIAGPYLLF